ncbi:MAG: transposase [Patescibacteria group bacterium]
MPRRLLPLVESQIYHVFNRGVDHRPVFTDKREFKRAVDVIDYYRFATPLIKFSKFSKLSSEEKNKIKLKIKNEAKLVDIFAFCLMPNHFHLLLRQTYENGISKFLSNFQNSYTRYFNTKNERSGHLFTGQFKAVLIETDEQLLHVSRYIHLNPATSYIVKDFVSLLNYPWSSLPEYIGKVKSFCEANKILEFFKTPEDHVDFLKDQLAYQRELDKIKHLTLE